MQSWMLKFSFLLLIGFLATGTSEIQYKQLKTPMIEETQPKSEPESEHRPVYPPTKKKPYTRVTKIA